MSYSYGFLFYARGVCLLPLRRAARILRKLFNLDGSFNNAAVAVYDDDLDRVLKDGLEMEVLSWKMLVEEPPAASLI